ncbi:hypothetical protein EJB05_10779, partial [Eragrostis curvula]
MEEGVISKLPDDVISKLPDDVLLLILGKVSLTTAVKANILSTQWKHLPWLLTQLSIDIKDFLHEPHADPTVDDHINKAMSSLAEAVRSMLAPTRRKSIITGLCISLFLINSYSSEIGHLVSEAIENGMVKDIKLTSGLQRLDFDVSKEEMVKHGERVHSFFHKYHSISCCLATLRLFNATIAESDMHNLLANTLTQLRSLCLYQCDTGFAKLFKIDAPNSKLNVLEFCCCYCLRVELVCLPKLELLICGYWPTPYLPLTLGSVPCLKEVEIYSATVSYQAPFKLSELLCSTSCINTLMLDFLGQKIWLQPEKNKLCSAFSSLKELSLFGIFVGFGLLWTTALLEAAPALEILHIEYSEILYMTIFALKRRKGKKDMVKELMRHGMCQSFSPSFKPLPLTTLQLSGFNATEDHIVFIGAVMKRASNLQTVILEELYCKQCSAIGVCANECKFPKNGDQQEVVVNKLKNRFSSSAQIMFREHKFPGA